MRKLTVALAAIIVGTSISIPVRAIASLNPTTGGLATSVTVLIRSDYVGPSPHQLSKTWRGYPIAGIC
jgi:hypothetical protein